MICFLFVDFLQFSKALVAVVSIFYDFGGGFNYWRWLNIILYGRWWLNFLHNWWPSIVELVYEILRFRIHVIQHVFNFLLGSGMALQR